MATGYYKLWVETTSGTFTEIPVVTNLKFMHMLNSIGTAQFTAYDTGSGIFSLLTSLKKIRVTKKDSTNGNNGTFIKDYYIRDIKDDNHNPYTNEYVCTDSSNEVRERFIKRDENRVGASTSASASSIVSALISDTGAYGITNNSSDTTGNAGTSITYRIENDQLLDAVLDIARTVDCYVITDTNDGTGSYTSGSNHNDGDINVGIYNPNSTIAYNGRGFKTNLPVTGSDDERIISKNETRIAVKENTADADYDTIVVLGAGSGNQGGDGNRVIGIYGVGGAGIAQGRVKIYRDAAIENQAAADKQARTLYERQAAENRQHSNIISATLLRGELHSALFDALPGDVIRIEKSDGTFFDGTYWGFAYDQMRESLDIILNRGHTSELQEQIRQAREARKHTDYAQVTDLDETVASSPAQQLGSETSVGIEYYTVTTASTNVKLFTWPTSVEREGFGYVFDIRCSWLSAPNGGGSSVYHDGSFYITGIMSGVTIFEIPFASLGNGSQDIRVFYPYALPSTGDLAIIVVHPGYVDGYDESYNWRTEAYLKVDVDVRKKNQIEVDIAHQHNR